MSTRDRTVTALGLGGVAAFQLALALGAPWGRASYGGQHEGVLPRRLRWVSAGATVVYAGVAVTVASERTPPRVRRGVLTAVAGLMSVAVVPNAMSRSALERAIWTPASGALAYAAWRARGSAGE
ncbi:hypothetical protein [uncultured Serinicoccus sp.]|uniref:hypothetical protein n=1 Tax=uncultured Serinicoccus sp. TaxID=735514 RepID=UPI002607B9EC|nr:hypothetical protein [uncultured Serinicoccus sp.]